MANGPSNLVPTAVIIIFQLPYLLSWGWREWDDDEEEVESRGNRKVRLWLSCFRFQCLLGLIPGHRFNHLMASISDSIRMYWLTTMCDLRLGIDWPAAPSFLSFSFCASSLVEASCNFSQLRRGYLIGLMQQLRAYENCLVRKTCNAKMCVALGRWFIASVAQWLNCFVGSLTSCAYTWSCHHFVPGLGNSNCWNLVRRCAQT